MTVACLTAVVLALVVLLALRERAHDQALDAKDQRHREEIRELTTRIQHPRLIPHPARQVVQPTPPDHKLYGQIGTLNADPQENNGG